MHNCPLGMHNCWFLSIRHTHLCLYMTCLYRHCIRDQKKVTVIRNNMDLNKAGIKRNAVRWPDFKAKVEFDRALFVSVRHYWFNPTNGLLFFSANLHVLCWVIPTAQTVFKTAAWKTKKDFDICPGCSTKRPPKIVINVLCFISVLLLIWGLIMTQISL